MYQRLFLSLGIVYGLRFLNMVTLKVNIDENEIHFVIWVAFISRKKKYLYTQQKQICVVLGNGAITESIVSKQFGRFRSRNCDLVERERCDRPVITDDDQIETLIKNNSGNVTQDKDTRHIS